jgi:hypothetical protein
LAPLPQVRVFNRDFINATLSQSAGGIAPIYFLGEDSAEKQAQVDHLKKDLAFANTEVMAAQTDKTNADSKLDDFCRDKAKLVKELLTTAPQPRPTTTTTSEDSSSAVQALTAQGAEDRESSPTSRRHPCVARRTRSRSRTSRRSALRPSTSLGSRPRSRPSSVAPSSRRRSTS